MYDYSTVTSQQIQIGSPTWRNNVSTSITDDATRTYDNGVYVDSSIASVSSPYTRRQQISDIEQTTTVQNVDDSISRSTFKYNAEISPGEPINSYHQQRTVRRQIKSSTPQDYENLSNYRSGVDTQGKVPITTQSLSRKPIVVDEIETIETETHVECQIQRTNETKETTKTERIPSPKVSTTKTQTIISRPVYDSNEEITSSKHAIVIERPPYYESIKISGKKNLIFFF